MIEHLPNMHNAPCFSPLPLKTNTKYCSYSINRDLPILHHQRKWQRQDSWLCSVPPIEREQAPRVPWSRSGPCRLGNGPSPCHVTASYCCACEAVAPLPSTQLGLDCLWLQYWLMASAVPTLNEGISGLIPLARELCSSNLPGLGWKDLGSIG